MRQIIHFIFLVYTLLLLARIIGSWIPQLQHQHWMRFVVHYTDPYLNIFRKFIPPIGGMLDISPIIAFFVLRITESFVLRLLPF